VKIIIIKRIIGMCLSCDFKLTFCRDGNWGVECQKENREVKDPTNIPSWCPLEDCKEADHETPA